MTLDQPTAERFAAIALGHVTREWPHALSHVLDGPADVRSPRSLHPVFYGSFDWHSCVHTYWMLAALLRRYPGNTAISKLFDAQLTPEHVAGECAYFSRPAARGFERPYGWAWLLALHHALRETPWEGVLRPLAEIVADRFEQFLPIAHYPVRVGTHFNTAFALTVAAPWAVAQRPRLHALLAAKARAWYSEDVGCQAWEPAQDDFLSPALIEALCMLRLEPPGFSDWFADFLPDVRVRQPATLFTPASVSDRSDGKIAHLDGLNLSRAWCWRELAGALDPAGRHIALAAAREHRSAALRHVEGDFMGEHWLATFAVLALEPGMLTG